MILSVAEPVWIIVAGAFHVEFVCHRIHLLYEQMERRQRFFFFLVSVIESRTLLVYFLFFPSLLALCGLLLQYVREALS